jgi:hypothetical protein
MTLSAEIGTHTVNAAFGPPGGASTRSTIMSCVPSRFRLSTATLAPWFSQEVQSGTVEIGSAHILVQTSGLTTRVRRLKNAFPPWNIGCSDLSHHIVMRLVGRPLGRHPVIKYLATEVPRQGPATGAMRNQERRPLLYPQSGQAPS